MSGMIYETNGNVMNNGNAQVGMEHPQEHSDVFVLANEGAGQVGIDAADVNECVAHAVGSLYYAIYHIWLKEESFICFREAMVDILPGIGTRGDMSAAFDHYIENYIVADDRDSMRAFTCASTLGERLAGVDRISHEYRRIGLGWTRGQFVVSKRDENGEPDHVLFVVSDITMERDLVARERTATFYAEHDVLSGALNRKAFQSALHEGLYPGECCGFALFDIDNFKAMNDEYGHGFGDSVISELGASLLDTFRAEDLVYRLGGDEFAVVLKDCGPSCWSALCEKVEHVCRALSLAVDEDMDITLSVGVCFGDCGFQEWMYAAADKGLYHSKEAGRAGCTLVDAEGSVLETWQDSDVSVRPLAAMAGGKAGTGRIEIPSDGSPARFFCGKATAAIYGMPAGLTPEERFVFWYKGVDPAYRDTLARAHAEMLTSENVECVFLWKGEGSEPFFVRSAGSGKRVGGTDIIFGLHRSLEGASIVRKEDDSQLILDAQNRVYISSCYVDIGHDEFDMLRDTDVAACIDIEGMGAAEAFGARVMGLVDEAYREKMLAFVDLSTLPARMGSENSLDEEFLASTGIGWCRASWLPVKHDEAGNVTHALYVVANINASKAAEIERERESARFMGLHYKAAQTVLDSKVIGMVLFSAATGEGQLWELRSGFTTARAVSYDELVARDSGSHLALDGTRLAARLNRERIVSEVAASGHCIVSARFHGEDGTVRYIKYHFSDFEQDSGMLFGVVEDDTFLREREGRTVKSLFTEVPGGLATYEWDGEKLTVVNISKRYEQRRGSGFITLEDGRRALAFEGVHPEDRAKFSGRFLDAIESRGSFRFAYRVWEETAGEYVWEQADVDIEEREDGSVLLYAMYTDVTELVQAKESLNEADRSLLRAKKAFENRMESLLYRYEDALSIGIFNISKGTVADLSANAGIFKEGADFTYDEALAGAAVGINDETDRQEYLRLFSADNILQLVEQGQTHVSMECFYTVEPGRTEWVEVSAEFLPNPETGDVEAIGITRVVTRERLSFMLASKFSSGALSSSSVLFNEGDEFYVFDNAQTGQKVHRDDYWNALQHWLGLICSEEELKRIRPLVSKERVIHALRAGHSPKVAFHAEFGQMSYRMQIAFSVLDEERGLIFAAVQNITDEELSERMRHEARHDALTGLYNRQTAFAQCEKVLDEHPDVDFVMVTLNVRRFRMYNEFFGEEAGNELLKTIANSMRRLSLDYECRVYGRIEADVFFGFFPLDEKVLNAHLEHVKLRFAQYRSDFLLEPSVGVYLVDDRSLSIEAMFARATSAAKEGGTLMPNGARYYNEQLEHALETELAIVSDMRQALEKEQFKVFLQPKFDLQSGVIAGAEALVRWDSPTHGLVSPGVFIPVFEGKGFIGVLDQYMWEHVCRLLRRWLDEGREVMPVSVNVSRLSAYSPSTVPFLMELVKRYDLDPALLELELTESAYIDDPEELGRTLGQLRDCGFRILMDDFGSGYSSLNTLRKLPVDVLKLDMAFMTETCDDERGRAVLAAVVAMAKSLRLPVVAEGVETQMQAEYLRSLDCEYVQGFLFARPMPVGEYEELAAGARTLPG